MEQTLTAFLQGISWAGVAGLFIVVAVKPLVPELISWLKGRRGVSHNEAGDEVDMGSLDDRIALLGSNHITHVQAAIDSASRKLDDLNTNVSRGFQDLSRQLNDLNQSVAYVKGRLNGKSSE